MSTVRHTATVDLSGTTRMNAGLDVMAIEALTIRERESREKRVRPMFFGLIFSFLAQMTYAKGDHARALELYQKALAHLELIGDQPEVARVQSEMGWTALAGGDARAACKSFRLAVQTYEEVGSPRGTGLALLGLGFDPEGNAGGPRDHRQHPVAGRYPHDGGRVSHVIGRLRPARENNLLIEPPAKRLLSAPRNAVSRFRRAVRTDPHVWVARLA